MAITIKLLHDVQTNRVEVIPKSQPPHRVCFHPNPEIQVPSRGWLSHNGQKNRRIYIFGYTETVNLTFYSKSRGTSKWFRSRKPIECLTDRQRLSASSLPSPGSNPKFSTVSDGESRKKPSGPSRRRDSRTTHPQSPLPSKSRNPARACRLLIEPHPPVCQPVALWQARHRAKIPRARRTKRWSARTHAPPSPRPAPVAARSAAPKRAPRRNPGPESGHLGHVWLSASGATRPARCKVLMIGCLRRHLGLAV